MQEFEQYKKIIHKSTSR